ncbi:hypothetical protein [Pontibaca methylaminivorans]|uniref:hypothetical protein n=1 Tax=Pontibaca methylaminivorans TaxID=515897 RepID=UPI002FDB2427
MSQSDSFINEVTEEVRRDRLKALMRRYGWIVALVVVVALVAAGGYELRKMMANSRAEELGDAILAALENDELDARQDALQAIEARSTGGKAVVAFLTAAAEARSGENDAAVARLDGIAGDGDLPVIYRQIAAFKALPLQGETLPPGAPLRLLAQEQLALIDIEENEREAAIDRLQELRNDAEAPADLQQRAARVIVALGGSVTDSTPRRVDTEPGEG